MRKLSYKATRPIHDFQIFKGRTEADMTPFGLPLVAHHEARLLVRDDQENLPAGVPAIYAIYKRSENRILQILRTADALSLDLAA